ncbi:TetR family transcriptional regulator [Vibrio breoganii]|uniref:TetR family transcriptional regulator n=1 Tax=Vibrio breoganii TaxID=553239 RepID=A0AAN0XX89_9VIBR|nr:TetR/AcrR family transcriptional regulator [Vibrio breoganii]ANO34163.1 TetR family transcriptional regulator [Vibrio breoganii]
MKKTRSELKREAILTAAKQSFLEFGVKNTSMDKLASLANVSKRTVYNHFSSKEALVIELVGIMWREAVQEINLDYQPDMPLEEQLEKVLLAEIEASCGPDYIELARVAIGHYFYSPEELQLQVAKFSKEDSAIAVWAKQGMADGKLKECEVSLFTEQAYALIKGYYFWPLLVGMRDFPTQEEKCLHAERSAELLLSHYKLVC